METGSEFVQPEFVFWGERAASTPSYVPMTVAKKFAKERQENLDDPEGIYSVERMGLQSNVTLLQQKLHDILPMYYDFTGFLSSGTYPAANMLLSKMFISKKKYTIGNTGLRPMIC